MTNCQTLVNQEARIMVTAKCNYKCVFCHNEGQDDQQQSWKPDKSKIFNLVDEIVDNGCKDITLTGGEPLLYKDIVLDVVRHVYERDPNIQVTIVSNASLLTDELTQQLKDAGNVRMNVSLHSAQADQYAYVTGQRRVDVDAIKGRLDLLRKAEIPFKLNCVAMREWNMTTAGIEELCKFANQTGAMALKIIELLIMEQGEHLYKDFISIDTIEKRLPESFRFTRRTDRRKEYTCESTGLVIELQRCRCRYGCKQCLSHTTANFNAAGTYWPCFEYSDQSFDVGEGSLGESLKRGRRVLCGLAKKFGSDSPSLLKDVEYVKRKRELFLEVEESVKLKSFLDTCRKTRTLNYSEISMTSQNAPDGQYVTVRTNHGDEENSKLVITDRFVEQCDGHTVTSTVFLDEKGATMVSNKDGILQTMKRLGWTVSGVFNYQLSGYETVAGTAFTIATINDEVRILRHHVKNEIPADFEAFCKELETVEITRCFSDYREESLLAWSNSTKSPA